MSRFSFIFADLLDSLNQVSIQYETCNSIQVSVSSHSIHIYYLCFWDDTKKYCYEYEYTCMYGSSLRICIVQMYCIFIWDGSQQFNLSMMFDYTKAHSSNYCFSMFGDTITENFFSISNWKQDTFH